MSKDTNWRQIASVYIGTVIGAGFASGQEILQFFVNYGYKGIIGAAISTALFMIIATIILLKVHNDKIENYQQLIVPVMGKKISIIVEITMLSYLFIGACIMVAGSGALFEEQFGIPYNIGLIVMAILTLLTVMHSVKGILTANTILIPILLTGIVFISILTLFKQDFNFNSVDVLSVNKSNWFISSIMYVNYNIISAIVVLTSLLSVIKSRKTAIKGGLIGGLGLGVLAVFIIIPLLLLYKDVSNLEIPMLRVAKYAIKNGDVGYSFLIWIAMFTTSVSNSFGFLTRICDIIKINFKLAAIIFCTVIVFVAKMGFSNLVNTFYPLFGYIGSVLIIIFIVVSIYKKIKK